jgi:hypothetical protein
MTASRQQFWGKYRARVSDNGDPYKLGRLKLKIPDVLGDKESGWALPSFPLAAAGLTPGSGVGLFLVPPADAWVWAEFEHGDPDKPIWTGCFFPAEASAVPAAMAALAPLTGVDPDKQVLKVGKWVVTFAGDTLTIQHLLVAAPRTRLKLDGNSIKLSTEQIEGASPPTCSTAELSGATVTVNGASINLG